MSDGKSSTVYLESGMREALKKSSEIGDFSGLTLTEVQGHPAVSAKWTPPADLMIGENPGFSIRETPPGSRMAEARECTKLLGDFPGHTREFHLPILVDIDVDGIIKQLNLDKK